MIKRVFDFSLALSGIFFSFPLWFILGFAVWLEDSGPVLYFQERVGKDGKIFKSLKFRSMLPEAEKDYGPLQALENDQRVTKLGKILRATAMDELPQLWNILKGEMSFVGPRALRPVEQDPYDSLPRSVWEFKGFKERCSVRPGLTGVAQIFAPRDINRNEKIQYDLWYIKNQYFLLDIYLIYISFLITFKGGWELRKSKLPFLFKIFNSLPGK